MKEILQKLAKAFEETYGSGEGLRFFFAPSRINLIGEHIDYNGGKVFPFAITIGTYGVARPNGLSEIRLRSLNMETGGSLSIPLPPYQEERDWLNYGAGVFQTLQKKGYPLRGFDGLVWGNIPNGSGLSSSASLELLLGQMMSSLFADGRIPIRDLVEAGIWCENEFFGLHTGMMDQYVIGFGKKDHAMLLDTAKWTHEQIPFHLPGYRTVILNSKKRRELKDSKYNERRGECEQALAILRKEKEIRCLCDLTSEDLPLLQKLENPILKKRARHVITENVRVGEAVQALQEKNWERLGALLRESQRSLSQDYEVSGPYLDAITEAANAVPSCLGARMTGAGFGGCGIALVKEEAIEDFSDRVTAVYRKQTGLTPELIPCLPDDGVREIPR